MKVLICGAESSGKSTLCAQLAAHFDGICVAEQSRAYLNELQRPYQLCDLLEIARIQSEAEAAAEAQNLPIFCDTGSINIHLWLREKYGAQADWIAEKVPHRPYDFALLLEPDLPWKSDSLRENKGRGMYFYQLFEAELKRKRIPFVSVGGTDGERLKHALKSIENYQSIGR